MLQSSSSATRVDGELPKSQCRSSGYHKPRMRHKSDSKSHVRCQTPSIFAGPWIPPPGRTTRGARHGWQVYVAFGLSVSYNSAVTAL